MSRAIEVVCALRNQYFGTYSARVAIDCGNPVDAECARRTLFAITGEEWQIGTKPHLIVATLSGDASTKLGEHFAKGAPEPVRVPKRKTPVNRDAIKEYQKSHDTLFSCKYSIDGGTAKLRLVITVEYDPNQLGLFERAS